MAVRPTEAERLRSLVVVAKGRYMVLLVVVVRFDLVNLHKKKQSPKGPDNVNF